ncbi:glycosyltransferase family 4 protein [Methanobacterium congolense]|uniref:Glycosyl transferase group 1 n=1 Tax=Methanobacterium congolense TaxID=118062 RepID=A0A1D3L2I1_9EURY|nr:glycosyltransferase family 4 protein [Methanobacterium congolense]SCG85776.1 Glycosyl transferase group 1 [Methanobacterium congolense]
MDIGIVQPELIYLRGAEKQVCKLSHHLTKMGHDVTIYTFEKKENYGFDSSLENVNIVSLDTRWFISSIFSLNHFRWVHLIKKLSSKLGDHDIINAHNHPAQWISKFTDIPTVWMCNEPYYRDNFIDNYYSANIQFTLPISHVIEKIIKNRYPQTKLETIGSGADLERDIKHIHNDYFDLIFVGPLHPKKRQLDIVKAFSLIKNDIKNVRLHFVGGTVDAYSNHIKKSMISLADKNGLNIFFYDSISNEELYSLYDVADISVFVPESEPWGIFPLETILGGIPTIISDQCGVKDILPDDHPVVETGNIKQLADKILEVKNNYDEYKNKTLQTSKTITENYSWESYSKRMETIFNKIIE